MGRSDTVDPGVRGRLVEREICGVQIGDIDLLESDRVAAVLGQIDHRGGAVCGACQVLETFNTRDLAEVDQVFSIGEIEGRPLVSREAVVNLIGHTTTTGGLMIRSELDENSYATGQLVSEEEMEGLHLKRDKFHREWNYKLTPRD